MSIFDAIKLNQQGSSAQHRQDQVIPELVVGNRKQYMPDLWLVPCSIIIRAFELGTAFEVNDGRIVTLRQEARA